MRALVRRGVSARLALALATVFCLGLHVSAVQASGSSLLTLTGSHTGYVDISLRDRAEFDLFHATFAGRGRFIGLYAESIDTPVADRTQPGARVGLVSLRDYHGPGDPAEAVELDAGNRYLAAGRYRVYLIADGQATVRVPISGRRSLTLTPRHPSFASAAIKPNILQDPLEASNRQPITVVGARAVTFSSITVGRFHAYAGEIGACLARTGQDCGSASSSAADGGYTGWFVSPLVNTEFSWTAGYAPGAIPAGQYDALQSALNVTTIQFATGAAFSLTLK